MLYEIVALIFLTFNDPPSGDSSIMSGAPNSIRQDVPDFIYFTSKNQAFVAQLAVHPQGEKYIMDALKNKKIDAMAAVKLLDSIYSDESVINLETIRLETKQAGLLKESDAATVAVARNLVYPNGLLGDSVEAALAIIDKKEKHKEGPAERSINKFRLWWIKYSRSGASRLDQYMQGTGPDELYFNIFTMINSLPGDDVVPVYMDWICSLNNSKDLRLLQIACAGMTELQKFVGPIDVPNDLNKSMVDHEQFRTTLTKWWLEVRNKDQIEWITSRVTAKSGISFDYTDQESLSKLVAKVVSDSDDDILIYSVAAIVNRLFPDEEPIIYFFSPDIKEMDVELKKEAKQHLMLAINKWNANRSSYKWDSAKKIYSKK